PRLLSGRGIPSLPDGDFLQPVRALRHTPGGSGQGVTNGGESGRHAARARQAGGRPLMSEARAPAGQSAVPPAGASPLPANDAVPGTNLPAVWTLPVLPLKNTVLFPYMFMPLAAGRPGSVAAVEAAMATDEKAFIVTAQRNASVEEPGPDELYQVGTRVVVKKMARTHERFEMLVQGVERVRLVEFTQRQPYMVARVEVLPLPEDSGPEVDALYRSVIEQAKRAFELAQPDSQIQIDQMLAQAGDP